MASASGSSSAVDFPAVAEALLSGASPQIRNAATPALATRHAGVRVDTGTPGPMRAPSEASGSAALECAMDDAAEACGLDPLEFRLRNYAETDPATGRPFSSKALRECYAQAAERFGWARRPLARMRDAAGRLVGWGMGTALFPAPMFRGEARAVLRADGTRWSRLRPSTWARAPGRRSLRSPPTGSGCPSTAWSPAPAIQTIPTAGSPAARITPPPRAARSSPPGPAWSPGSPSSPPPPASPLFGAGNAGVEARDGRLHHRGHPDRHESYADILARAGLAEIEGKGASARDPVHAEARAMFSHGAVSAEVQVGQMRVSRLVGAFSAARIINPHLARSQLLGA